MTYYIIKSYSDATEKNINFAGEKHYWFYGKRQAMIGKDYFPTTYLIKEYGYTTKAAATRGWKVIQELNEWENSYGNWSCHSEIVEVTL